MCLNSGEGGRAGEREMLLCGDESRGSAGGIALKERVEHRGQVFFKPQQPGDTHCCVMSREMVWRQRGVGEEKEGDGERK